MFGADKGTADRLDGKKLYIGIVQARFNERHHQHAGGRPATPSCWPGRARSTSTMCRCPARWKCRWRCRRWPRTDQVDALIALGCIIRGETYHFELVANESGAGVSRVSLDYQLPVANAILTTENLAQAVARQTDKGRDAARVAVEMANLLEDLG
jgi:6,7-dimethyl-8-ribityllumazine synthase